MASQASKLPPNHQRVVDHFIASCQGDERIVAAFLGGSYAEGTADAYSDLDFGIITTDRAFEEFSAGREAFIRHLGEPAFVEDFGLDTTSFFIFPNGVECELAVGHESRFDHLHRGPVRVLVDKKGLLAGAAFAGREPSPAEQLERLRRQIHWFWHDLSHFTTAMARGQPWWAHGQLETLRLYCVNLVRLRHDFSADADGYEKVDQEVPMELLEPLQQTLGAKEPAELLEAGLVLVGFYKDLAPPLAHRHGIPYPEDLAREMSSRLEKLKSARTPSV